MGIEVPATHTYKAAVQVWASAPVGKSGKKARPVKQNIIPTRGTGRLVGSSLRSRRQSGILFTSTASENNDCNICWFLSQVSHWLHGQKVGAHE